MTMTYCRTCDADVHITHDAEDCSGEPNLKVPSDLRASRVEREVSDE